jgi:hypothetical protein
VGGLVHALLPACVQVLVMVMGAAKVILILTTRLPACPPAARRMLGCWRARCWSCCAA